MTTKKFKLPKAVMIFGTKFEVKECKIDAGADEEIYGECRGHDRIIKIQVGQSPASQRRTLFHECIHAAFFVGGLSEMLSEVKGELEEAVVICLENAFSDIIDLDKIRID